MKSVIKGTSYILVHTPDMVLHNGATQTTERIVNPESEYLKEISSNLRSYEDTVQYWPNQTYIGNVHPEELAEIELPWFDKKRENSERYGHFGEIMPQAEFLLLVAACDMFEVVKLETGFVAAHKENFIKNPVISEDVSQRLQEGVSIDEIEGFVSMEHAEGLYHEGELVGCVKTAHDIDVNLSAHVMHENLMSKASSVLALLYAVKNAKINKEDVEYVIDCAEEACGDMNQRGGGNFAKAAAEIAGLVNATGSDLRGFCAAPAHAMIEAAALVKSGAYKTVIVTSGGCTAKLGMNGKDHLKKGLPILEDCLGGFAVVVSEDDGINPEINLDLLGRHTVGTGSAPQAVMTSLVLSGIEKEGLKITDIDKYSPEMQNPDITKPAGAGDVPLANYKMIGALAAKRGEITPKELGDFVAKHGLVGWAPTQGHIPSGVPYVGFACEDILAKKINTAMIIGKGSLFLGRMTNLFDGVSFVIQGNTGEDATENTVSEEEVKGLIAKAMKDFAMSLMSEETGA
jgi:3-oxoacyl-[acyl-carrier-protein] synthase III